MPVWSCKRCVKCTCGQGQKLTQPPPNNVWLGSGLQASRPRPAVQLLNGTALLRMTSVPLLRARRPDAERCSRHVQERGSAAAAAKACARCAWIRNRRKWEDKCHYVDAGGKATVWLLEQPNPAAPWGLGCRLCAARAELQPAADDSSFARRSTCYCCKATACCLMCRCLF